MINSNQPTAFITVMICLRIIWRFEYCFVHIQPWITFLVWNWCKVKVCRKSHGFHVIIRSEFNIHFVCWDWYDFLIPIADSWFRFGTTIWTSQMCYQFPISISINLLYWYVITIKIWIKLLKWKYLEMVYRIHYIKHHGYFQIWYSKMRWILENYFRPPRVLGGFQISKSISVQTLFLKL